MALFFADLVREASWGVGAGDLPLGGALPGHRRFADAAPPGARFHYCIAGVTHPDEWETGEGEIGSADTLIRLPLASSAGGDAVLFSPGLKTVALTVNADWFAVREEGGAIDPEALDEALAAKADLAGAAFGGAVSAPGLSLDTPLAIADGGTGGASAAAARAALGLTVGAEVQAHHPTLTALSGLALAADRLPYADGAGTLALATFTAAGRALLDDADAAAQRATLGLGALATLSGIGNGNWSGTDLAIANGGTGASSAAAARANLGLGTAAVQAVGTSGANVPLLDGANIWSGNQRVNASLGIGAAPNNPLWVQATNVTPATNTTYHVGIGTGGFGRLTLGLDGSNCYVESWDRTLVINGQGRATNINPASGTATYGGIEIGWRDIPRVTGGLERGKCLAASGSVTVSAGSAAGSACSIYNDSGSAITITQGSGLTLRLGGTGTSGSRTLAARGFCTIWFNSTTEAVISGAGVS